MISPARTLIVISAVLSTALSVIVPASLALIAFGNSSIGAVLLGVIKNISLEGLEMVFPYFPYIIFSPTRGENTAPLFYKVYSKPNF